MPGKSGGQIIGYKYYLGMQMVICQGPVDALLGIVVGERMLFGWESVAVDASGHVTHTVTGEGLPGNFGSGVSISSLTSPRGTGKVTSRISPAGITSSRNLHVTADELFGGDTREGGIAGDISICMGEATQAPNSYLQNFFGAYCPAFRGVTSVVLKHIYIGVNPYLKPWSFLVRRAANKDWHPTKALIEAADWHFDCNPAHIIREVLTAPDSMGYPEYLIDDIAFTYAADTLYMEKFGLSLIWDQQSTIEEFIQVILNHINGVLYVSETTGKFVLKLIRADYVVSALPLFDETTILTLDNYQRAAWGETINEIAVRYTDRYTAKGVATTVQDIANAQVQGAIISQTQVYKGIADANLAARVAQRDLQIYSTPLGRVKFTVNRKAWNLRPGDTFRFSWERLGIEQMVFRVGQIDRGTLTEGAISVEAVEDVFALPAVEYMDPETVMIPAPVLNPIPATHQRLIETSFWDYMMYRGTTEALAQDDFSSWVLGAVARPAPTSAAYTFETSGVGEAGPFDGAVLGNYSPACALPTIPQQDVTTVNYTAGTDLSAISVGDYGYINNEAVSIAAINTDTSSITLNRGVLDTVPVPHEDPILYVTSRFKAANTWEYAAGELITGFVRPRMPAGTLPRSSATPLTLELSGRHGRPYPPGNLRLNGSRFPASLSKIVDIVITWAHRNRAQQTAYIVLQTEGNIGPEPGVTYSVTVLNSRLGIIKSETGLSSTTTTLTAAEFAAAVATSARPTLSHYAGSTNIVEVWATRNGIHSYQKAVTTYVLT